jgi:hypothetical protein
VATAITVVEIALSLGVFARRFDWFHMIAD